MLDAELLFRSNGASLVAPLALARQLLAYLPAAHT